MVKESSFVRKLKSDMKGSGKITESMAQVVNITLQKNHHIREPFAKTKSVDKVNKLGVEKTVAHTLANGLTT